MIVQFQDATEPEPINVWWYTIKSIGLVAVLCTLAYRAGQKRSYGAFKRRVRR